MPKFRRVTGLFRAAIPDGPDVDYTPDLEALNGMVEFIPRYRGGVIAYPHLDPPEFVRPEPIQAVLQDGYVMTQVSVGEETTIQPVELMVSDDDEATQSWQWEALFRDIRVGRWGDEVSISPIRFTVPDEHGPLDLTEVVGEKQSGVVTVKGPRGEGLTDIRAEGGELIVEWGADKRLVIPVPDAVPGPKGDKGDLGPVGPPGTVDLIGGSATITVSKQVGTSVSIGDVRIYYDSGLRSLTAMAGLTSGNAYLHVKGGWVYVMLEDAVVAGTGSVDLLTTQLLPVSPQAPVGTVSGVLVNATNAFRRIGVNRLGRLRVYGVVPGDILNGSLAWPMTRPDPTTAIGSPA